LVLDKSFLYNNLFLFKIKNSTENGPGHTIGIFLSKVFSAYIKYRIYIEQNTNSIRGYILNLGD
jgi:hypothetical protein